MVFGSTPEATVVEYLTKHEYITNVAICELRLTQFPNLYHCI